MVEPVLIAAGVGAAGVAVAAGYSYLTGNDSSAGVDIDDDGTNEAEVNFEGEKEVDEAEEEADDTVSADTNPEHLDEYSGLTDIKGIQSARAEKLGRAGFPNPEDIYYASDENLKAVSGIGPSTVEMFREDIGGIDYDAEGNESTDDSTSEEESTTQESTSDEEETGTEQTDESTDGDSDESSDEEDADEE